MTETVARTPLATAYAVAVADAVMDLLAARDRRPAPPLTALVAHGSPGDPGYRLLHGGFKQEEVLNGFQVDFLHEELDKAHSAGLHYGGEYNPYTDPNSPLYDPDDPLEEGQTRHVDWRGLAQHMASGDTDHWFGDFDNSRRIRRAANARLGLAGGQQDPLLGQGPPIDDYDDAVAVAMLAGLATSRPVPQELYRGTYVEGGDPEALEAALRTGTMDFGLVSFTNSQGVAEYFSDPSMYQQGPSQGGTQIMFVAEPGAQGIIGRQFSEGMSAGNPGIDTYDPLEDLTDLSLSRGREIVTGGRFDVVDVIREDSFITVRLRQQYTYDPTTGEPA